MERHISNVKLLYQMVGDSVVGVEDDNVVLSFCPQIRSVLVQRLFAYGFVEVSSHGKRFGIENWTFFITRSRYYLLDTSKVPGREDYDGKPDGDGDGGSGVCKDPAIRSKYGSSGSHTSIGSSTYQTSSSASGQSGEHLI